MEDVDKKRMAAGSIDEHLRQAPGQEAPPGGIDRPSQCGSDQKNPEPWDQRKIVERGVARAVDAERQQPIEVDGHAFFQQVNHRGESQKKNTPDRAGDGLGLLERHAEYQDGNGEKLEDAEPDSRRRVENISDRGDGYRHDKETQTPARVAP